MKSSDGPPRSPISDLDRPLRNPGQYLEQERERFLFEQFVPHMMLPLLAVLLAALEWWRYLVPSHASPIWVSLLALGICVYSAVRFPRMRRHYRALSEGLKGEKVVGQALEQLRADGWQVFHDIQGEGFNLDHVLISTRGVIVVETKTRTKPAEGKSTIRFDGERVLIAGYPNTEYLAQAESQRTWLRKLLKKETGKTLPVRSILVFPGWFVEKPEQQPPGDLWVLPLSFITGHLKRQPEVLPKADQVLAGSQLARYVQRAEE